MSKPEGGIQEPVREKEKPTELSIDGSSFSSPTVWADVFGIGTGNVGF